MGNINSNKKFKVSEFSRIQISGFRQFLAGFLARYSVQCIKFVNGKYGHKAQLKRNILEVSDLVIVVKFRLADSSIELNI